MTQPVHGVLDVARWYCYKAVYWNGRLLMYHQDIHIDFTLLGALGFKCNEWGEIPTHDIPPEFDRGERRHWKPPQTLAALQKQWDVWQERLKQERIADLKKELARLENP